MLTFHSRKSIDDISIPEKSRNGSVSVLFKNMEVNIKSKRKELKWLSLGNRY